MAEEAKESDVVIKPDAGCNIESSGVSNSIRAKSPYSVKVSRRIILVSLLSSVSLAFAVGRAARLILIDGPRRTAILPEYSKTILRDIRGDATLETSLPSLIAGGGKPVPHTRYSSKNFDTTKSASSSSWLITDYTSNRRHERDQVCSIDTDGMEVCTAGQVFAENNENDLQASATHLMVDIRNVETDFLNSAQRLARAMLNFVVEADLTLLWYHCHRLFPAGVSCLGLLPQNYVSFHTWPAEGVIILDLCAGKSRMILPILQLIKENFAVPRTSSISAQVMPEPPVVVWAHKLRGYRRHTDEASNQLLTTDLGIYVLVHLIIEYKERVTSVETEFQRIDIYDVIFPNEGSLESYRKSLADDGSYESENPFLFRPDRIVLLDGWIQSRLFTEAAYHEALVHPALFSHPNPRRVAIVGGGEGATLREILKHNTVEEAVMIEIDEEVVNVFREHIPEWSDCSDLVGSTHWCVEDSRARAYYEDALGWFMKRYSDGGMSNEPLDVIIMDALDPESEIPFAKALYNDDTFMKAFYNSLAENGVLVMQLGEAPKHNSPDEARSKYRNRAHATSLLERLGFESIHTYEESHCGFFAPWIYVVGFKSYSSRRNWYANAAEIDLEIQKRSVRTKSDANPFRYFDGPTMVSYQEPPRTVEAVFCRRTPTPDECLNDYQFDPEEPNFDVSSFEVKDSSLGEIAGRGLYTKVDIPEGAYLMAEAACHPVMFMPSTLSLIESLDDEQMYPSIENVEQYINGYGFASRYFGDREVFVDSALATFANHGCNGTYNIGDETAIDENSARADLMPDLFDGKSHKGTSKFNPVVARHLMYDLTQCKSLRTIKAGEELLDNYLLFLSSKEDWADYVTDLRKLCSGQSTGRDVTDYEAMKKDNA